MFVSLLNMLRADPTLLWPPALAHMAILAGMCLLLGWAAAWPSLRFLTQNWGERVLFGALIGVALLSWVGVLLAVLGMLRPWIMLAALAAVVVWARWMAGRGARCSLERMSAASAAPDSPPTVPHTPLLARLVLVVGLLLSAWLYARPMEGVFVRDDPSVYILGGIVLAHEGSLWSTTHPFWHAWLPQSTENPQMQPGATVDQLILPATDLVRQFGYVEATGGITRHYGPFYQWALTDPTLEIGFLPLTVVWTAFSVWLFGETAAASAAPLFAWFGLALLYVFARRNLGWRVGLLAVALCAGALPQVWFARLGVSEIYAQCLVLGGLSLYACGRSGSSRSTTGLVWSALLLGALCLTRLEGAVLVLALAGLVWAARRGREGRADLSLWLAALGGSVAAGLAISLGVARYYLFTRTLSVGPSVTRIALAACAALTLMGISAWRAGWLRNLRRLWLRRVHEGANRWLALALLGCWMAWSLAAVWLLVTQAVGASLPGWLSFYWTLPGLALSLIGILWLCGAAWRSQRRALAPEFGALLGLGGALLLAFTADPMINPVQPWAVRRLVPVVLPALAVTAAYPLARAWEWLATAAAGSHGARRTLLVTGAALCVALASLQAGGIAWRTWPIVFHQERQGLWRQMRALGERFPPGALLLFDDSPASQGVTSVMELLLDHPSAVIYDGGATDLPIVDEVLTRAQAQGRPAYLLLGGGKLDWRPVGWELQGVGLSCLHFPVLRQEAGSPPQADDVLQQELCLDAYRILPADWSVRAQATWQGEYSAGEGSYPYVRAGFYGLERGPDGLVWRWTDGDAWMTLPWPAAQPKIPASACLTLTVTGGRPVGESPATLHVLAEGQPMAEAELPTTFAPQSLRVRLDGVANTGVPQLELHLQSTTFQPVGDARTLGIQVLSAELGPLASCIAE